MYLCVYLCIYVLFLSVIVVGTYHGSQDQPHQVTGNHQQPPQQNTGFPRSSQPYYNSRGVSRGGSRGAEAWWMDTEDLLMDSESKTKNPKRKFIFFSNLHCYIEICHIFMKKLYLSALASYVQCKLFLVCVDKSYLSWQNWDWVFCMY